MSTNQSQLRIPTVLVVRDVVECDLLPIHGVAAQAQTNKAQVESTVILFSNQNFETDGAFKLGSSLHLRPHHGKRPLANREVLEVELRKTASDWSTRINHNTIVYRYRSCTQ